MSTNPISPNPLQSFNSNSEFEGGDIPFSELFPAEGLTESQTTAPQGNQPQVVEPPAPPAPPQAPTQDEFFLKGSKSVYKTAEEAQRGLDKKDELIETMRNRIIAMSGVDPLTQQNVTPTKQQESIHYFKNPQKFIEDLNGSLQHNKPEEFIQTHGRLLDEYMGAKYGPILNVIQDVGKQKAIETVGREFSDFPQVYNSESFQKALDHPAATSLKAAIQAAESDIRLQSELPGLYKIAYLASQGLRVPELVEQAKQQQAAQAAPAPRPLATNNTPPPPVSASQPSLSSKEGRQAIIKNWEANNGNFKF